MITVQPIVDRDDHCTAYCRKRYSLYSVHPIVDRDDHCTANCGQRWSLYSLLWKEILTVQCTSYCGQRWLLYSQLWEEMITVQPIVKRDTVQCTAYCGQRYHWHCTAYCGKRYSSLYSLLWKDTVQPTVDRYITVQPIVERDTHCTMYSLLWTDMTMVQPIVERDTQCTAYCGQRWSPYSQMWKEILTVQCAAYCVERDDHCTANCGHRWSLYSQLWTEILIVQCTAYCGQKWSVYSQLWKEMITILTKARHKPHTQPTQCQRNCSPVATHSASSPRTDYPPQPQFLHQSSALMASPPDLTDPGDESLSVPASHNPRVLRHSQSDTRLVLGRRSSLDRTASPPWNPHPSLCERSGHPGEFRWCTCKTLNVKMNHSVSVRLSVYNHCSGWHKWLC